MSEKKEAKKRLTYLKEKYVDGEGNIQSHDDHGELLPGCLNEEVAELSELLEQEAQEKALHVGNKRPERKPGELSEVGKALKNEGAQYLGNLPDGREFFYRKTTRAGGPGQPEQETQDALCVEGGVAKIVGQRFGPKLIGQLKK